SHGSDLTVQIDYANLGSSSIGLGRFAEAREFLLRSIDISTRANPRSFWIGWALMYESLAETALGHPDAGAEAARRGLALASDPKTSSPRLLVPLLVDLGNALLATGQPAEALAQCQRAAELLDPRLVAPDRLYEWDPLTCTGRALIDLNRAGEAVAPLERSATLERRVRAGDLAIARFTL